MDDMREIRRRIDGVQRRFDRLEDEQRDYSERLSALAAALEAAHGRKQSELDRLARENRELRAMLLDLLTLGIEPGSADQLGQTLRQLESWVVTLVGTPSGSVPSPARSPAHSPVRSWAPESMRASLNGEEPEPGERRGDDPSADDLFRAAISGDDAMADAIERLKATVRRGRRTQH